MASEEVTTIFECIEGLKSGDNAKIDSANEQLISIISEPTNSVHFFSAVSVSTQSYQRKYCYTLLHRMFTMQSVEIFLSIEGFFAAFQSFALSSLNSENDVDNMILIGDLIREISNKALKETSWPELYQLALEISQAPTERAVGGLHVLESIFGAVPEADQGQLFTEIVPILAATIESANERVRIHAFKLFTEVSIDIENPDQWEGIPTFIEALKASIFSVYERDCSVKEISSIFQCIGTLIGDIHFAYFNTFAPEFLQFCLTVIAAEEMPLDHRVLIKYLLQPALGFVLGDNPEEVDIPGILKSVIELTLQVCADSRDTDEFTFAAKSIEDLSYFVGYQGVSEMVAELISAETAEALQTALFVTSAAFPAIMQGVAENYQSILKLIADGFATDDTFIVDYASTLLSDMIDGCLPAIIGNFDDCVAMCLQEECLSSRQVITVIDSMYRRVKKESANSAQLLQEIIQRMRAEGADPLLVNEYLKLAATISLYMSPSEELFGELLALIDEVAENTDYCINVPRFIASLASVGPSIFVQNIGGILEKLAALTGQAYELNTEVADALIRIIHRFPISCTEVAPAIAEILAAIFNAEKEEEDESPDYRRSRVEALRALGCVNKISTEAIAAAFGNFDEVLMSILQSDDSLSQGAIYALYESAEVIDCSEFLSFFIQSEKFDPVLQPLIFQLMNEVFHVSGLESVKDLGEITTFFIARIGEMSTADELEKVDQRVSLINNSFEAFATLCDLAGEAIQPHVEPFVETLMELLESEESLFRANSLRVLTVISTKCISNEELLKAVILAALQFSVERTLEVSMQGFNSLCKFVTYEGVLEDMEDPIQVALQSINENNMALMPSAIAFLLSCAQMGAELPVPEFIDKVEELSFNNAQLVTVATKSAQLEVLKPKICIFSLASEPCVWNQINGLQASFVAGINGISEEDMFSVIEWNEEKIQRIRERVGGQ